VTTTSAYELLFQDAAALLKAVVDGVDNLKGRGGGVHAAELFLDKHASFGAEDQAVAYDIAQRFLNVLKPLKDFVAKAVGNFRDNDHVLVRNPPPLSKPDPPPQEAVKTVEKYANAADARAAAVGVWRAVEGFKPSRKPVHTSDGAQFSLFLFFTAQTSPSTRTLTRTPPPSMRWGG
jgi:hypothetical protein